MELVYKDEWTSLYKGSASDSLTCFGQKSVQAVICDPPYGVEIDSWDTRTPHEFLNDAMQLTDGPIVWFGAAPQLREDLMGFPTPPSRTLIWAPKFTLSRTASQGIFFRWHSIFTWNVKKPHDGPIWDILDTNTECGRAWKYKCSKPLKLMEQLVGFCPTNGTVLDPFCGSGTTLIAARNKGRKSIGIDNNQEALDISIKRLRGEYGEDRVGRKSSAIGK